VEVDEDARKRSGGDRPFGIPACGIPEEGIGSAVAIRSFSDPEVERLFLEGSIPRAAGWASVAKVAARKLDLLDYASILLDLAAPPGNRLEALKGELAGRHSIRINDRWRIVFRWTPAGPAEVEIVDYH
jgi:proteic killer suppression protein